MGPGQGGKCIHRVRSANNMVTSTTEHFVRVVKDRCHIVQESDVRGIVKR